MKKITILALLLTWGTATWAEENENLKTEEHKQVEESKRTSWNKYLHGYQYQARVAYNIGGTAPIGLPATIRTLHSYTLQPNFSLGIAFFTSINFRRVIARIGIMKQSFIILLTVMVHVNSFTFCFLLLCFIAREIATITTREANSTHRKANFTHFQYTHS